MEIIKREWEKESERQRKKRWEKVKRERKR